MNNHNHYAKKNTLFEKSKFSRNFFKNSLN